MNKELSGGCCCQQVKFTLEDNFQQFYFCHCEQCRKLTGTAHAANLFTSPDNIEWLAGQELTVRYDDPDRTFSKVFCRHCGSGLPFLTQNGRWLIVPAGSLDSAPSKMLDAEIFYHERATWHEDVTKVRTFEGFPD